MTTLVTLRALDGSAQQLAIGDGVWVDPEGFGVEDELDTSSLWAVPGLADCHAHLAASSVEELRQSDDVSIDRAVVANAWSQVSAGVFLVLDKGSKNSRTLRILAEPPDQRPAVEAAGTILTVAGGYYPGFGREVDQADLLGSVQKETGHGASWVKLIGDWPRKGRGVVSNFDESQLAAVVEMAHDSGCRVAIHAAGPDTSSMAVAAGVDSIEHGLFLTPDDLEALGDRAGAWVPTVLAMESTRDLLGGDSSGGRLFQKGLDNVRSILCDAPGAGVAVLTGSDLAIPHGTVAAEAVALERYGLTREAAVASATANAYEYTGRDVGFRIGEPANAVFFRNNPIERIESLLEPAVVLFRGSAINR